MLRNRGAAITAVRFSPPGSGAPGTAPAGAMTTLDMSGLARQPPVLIIAITVESPFHQSAMPGCVSATTSAVKASVMQLQRRNSGLGSLRSRVSAVVVEAPSRMDANRTLPTAPMSAVSDHGGRKRTDSPVKGCGSCWNSTPYAQFVIGTTGVRRVRRSTMTTPRVRFVVCCVSAVMQGSVNSETIRHDSERRPITWTSDPL
jgi:hypothetical protein